MRRQLSFNDLSFEPPTRSLSKMPITVERVSEEQATTVIGIEEGQFAEVKSVEITPAQLSKTVSAFTNSDGGDLFVGVSETGTNKVRSWEGFEDQEAANGHLQLFEKLFPLGTDFEYEFLECDSRPGLVLHVQVNKTSAIVVASNGVPYIRRGAQNLSVTTPDAMRRLEYGKGISSFESELTTTPVEMVTESEVTVNFIEQVVPSAEPAPRLRKQALVSEKIMQTCMEMGS